MKITALDCTNPTMTSATDHPCVAVDDDIAVVGLTPTGGEESPPSASEVEFGGDEDDVDDDDITVVPNQSSFSSTTVHPDKGRGKAEATTSAKNNGETSGVKKKKKTKMNRDFKDVKNTGKWGSVSKKDILIVASIAALLLVAVVVAVVVVTVQPGKQDDNVDRDPATGKSGNGTGASLPPTPQFATAKEKYAALLDSLRFNKFTASYLSILPHEYDSAAIDSNSFFASDPVVLGVIWAMMDADNTVDTMIDRFVLATMYFATGGENWYESTGWLEPDQHHCSWARVVCAGYTDRIIVDIDLSRNNLTGTIPATLSLLHDLISVWFPDNPSLGGPIPGDVLGSLPRLKILYLQDCSFTGTIPESLLDSGSLETLYVQGNLLEGAWPDSFCRACETCEKPFKEFGLDCNQTPCPDGCCYDGENCFE